MKLFFKKRGRFVFWSGHEREASDAHEARHEQDVDRRHITHVAGEAGGEGQDAHGSKREPQHAARQALVRGRRLHRGAHANAAYLYEARAASVARHVHGTVGVAGAFLQPSSACDPERQARAFADENACGRPDEGRQLRGRGRGRKGRWGWRW